MGNYRPLPTKCWEKFLTQKGYIHVRTKGSHHIWSKNGCRPIPVWGAGKEIPAMHLKTSCGSMGIVLDDLYAWAAENC
jgi:predicted RNA binding protein YcfA (HicA-like mRNA interferase family)